MTVHVVDSSGLAEKLASGDVTTREQVTYLLVGWVFFALLGYSTLTYSNSALTWPGVLEAVAVVVITVFGIRHAYRSNGGDQGEQFVMRFSCLLLPVAIKVNAIVWGLFHLLGWFFRALFPSLTFSSERDAELAYWFAHQHLPWVITFIAVSVSHMFVFVGVAKHLSKIEKRAKR